jgi:competence ComEA-like helix-hairpin-helix protein
MSANATTDAERVQEQMRYFGLTNASQVIRFGEEARRYVERTLSKPFTIQTARAKAPGRFGGRIYAFVTVDGGKDLGAILVQAGLARPHGMDRETPAGVSGTEKTRQLQDSEASAMLKRTGIWAKSSPEHIAELRQEQRDKNAELDRVREEAKPPRTTDQRPIDLNTASVRELEALPGIGRKLALLIIQDRPYKTVDDLLKVEGIGKKKLEAIRSKVVVGPNQSTSTPKKEQAP